MTGRLVMSEEWSFGGGDLRFAWTRSEYHENEGYCIDHRQTAHAEERWLEHVQEIINQEDRQNYILRVTVGKSPYPGYPGWCSFNYMFYHRMKQHEYRMLVLVAEGVTTKDYLRHIYQFIQK